MSADLSSVARETARELERQLPGGSYADGWADCASRLPSEEEICSVILGRTATAGARAVRELIERKMLT